MKLKKMLAWLTTMATIGTVVLATGCDSEETSSESESSVVEIQENTAVSEEDANTVVDYSYSTMGLEESAE